MATVAGLDYSTHAIDCVLVDEDTGEYVAWHRWPLEAKGDAFDRARWIRHTMPARSWWDDRGVVACGIEDPRGMKPGPLFRIQGAILSCLPTWLLVHPLVPSEWRKLVGLPGNATKLEVVFHARDHSEMMTDAWTQDTCDAYCIATATRTLIQR
jgi:hypothetical protein